MWAVCYVSNPIVHVDRSQQGLEQCGRDYNHVSNLIGGHGMARKKKTTRRIARRGTTRPGRSAKVRRIYPVASDVWLEIGPIWLERNPRDIREVVVRESHTRRMKQG
jgi:hypothetical protein